jgi:hypothetical protein
MRMAIMVTRMMMMIMMMMMLMNINKIAWEKRSDVGDIKRILENWSCENSSCFKGSVLITR